MGADAVSFRHNDKRIFVTFDNNVDTTNAYVETEMVYSYCHYEWDTTGGPTEQPWIKEVEDAELREKLEHVFRTGPYYTGDEDPLPEDVIRWRGWDALSDYWTIYEQGGPSPLMIDARWHGPREHESSVYRAQQQLRQDVYATRRVLQDVYAPNRLAEEAAARQARHEELEAERRLYGLPTWPIFNLAHEQNGQWFQVWNGPPITVDVPESSQFPVGTIVEWTEASPDERARPGSRG